MKYKYFKSFLVAVLVPLLMSSCYTLRYDHTTKQRTISIETLPKGGILQSSNANTKHLIVSDNKLKINVAEWLEADMVLFVLPNWWNKPASEIVPPTDIYVQWPSGARKKVELRKWNTSIFSETVSHPGIGIDASPHDEALYEYDRWIGDGGITTQQIVFTTSPAAEQINIDGKTYYGGSVTSSWPFTVREYLSSSKYVRVSARWPSGVETSINSIPIGRARYAFAYGGQPKIDSVSILHPSPSTAAYKYDEIAQSWPRGEDHVPRPLEISIISDPEGATIYIDERNWGKAPLTINGSVSPQIYAAGYAVFPVRAVWPSKAETLTNVIAQISSNTVKQPKTTVVIQRPSEATGANDDIRHGREVKWEREYSKKAPVITVTIDSDPAGAILSFDNIEVGSAPQQFRVELLKNEYINNIVPTKTVSARWSSGATMKTVFNLSSEPGDYVGTVSRPSTHPNAKVDVAAAAWNKLYSKSPPSQRIAITTDPDGATIYVEGRHHGNAPQTISIPISRAQYINGTDIPVTVSARWASGATADHQFSLSCEPVSSIPFTFIRPTDAPNLELDIMYAIEHRNIGERARTAATQQSIMLNQQIIAEQAAREAREYQNSESIRLRQDQQRQQIEQQRINRERADADRNRLYREQEAAREQKRLADQQLLLHQQSLAEQRRANQAREQQERNNATLNSMRMLTDQLNRQYQPSPPSEIRSYEIAPKYPSLDQDPMAPGSYFNPYQIKQK